VATKKWIGEKAWVSLTSVFVDFAESRFKSPIIEMVSTPTDGFL
jgi:hypothetical protein